MYTLNHIYMYVYTCTCISQVHIRIDVYLYMSIRSFWDMQVHISYFIFCLTVTFLAFFLGARSLLRLAQGLSVGAVALNYGRNGL